MDRGTIALIVGIVALVVAVVGFMNTSGPNLTNGTAVINVASITAGDVNGQRVLSHKALYLGTPSVNNLQALRSEYQLNEGTVLMGSDVSEGVPSKTAGQIVPYPLWIWNLGGATTNGTQPSCQSNQACTMGFYKIMGSTAVDSTTDGPAQVYFTPVPYPAPPSS